MPPGGLTMGTHYRGTREEIRALDAHIKLLRCANGVRAALEGGLREAGLTESQLGVLEVVLHLGPLCQHEIGDKLLISRANVTLVVDQLSDRGLVQRQRDEDDRRRMRVSLTREGRRRIETLFPEHVGRIVRAMAHLTAAEQEQLSRLCRKLGLGLVAAGRGRPG